MSTSAFPVLSANTLFHFTGSIENLLNILTNEFRPHLCLEDFNILLQNDVRDEINEFAIPMVCFCDVPLSQTRFHLSVYGDYGIGLTKTWGKSKGIAPVLYAYPESSLTSKIRAIGDVVRKMKHEESNQALFNELFRIFVDFMYFIKPYEGNLWRESGTLPDIRFYNEREWRFVANVPDGLYLYGMPKADFFNEEVRREANTRIAEISRISFVPNDIKYLIVRREDEIVPLIRELEGIKGNKYSYDDVKLLSSRVISAEQIRSDF